MLRWTDTAGDKGHGAVEAIARVVVAVMLPVASASGQTFSHIITETVALGRMNHVFVVADLNGDTLDDIVVGDKVDHDPDFTPADRLTKVPLHIFVSNGDGTFTHAPELVDGQIEAHDAVVLSADFNGDGRNELVVYDHGAYVDSESSGYGNPPQLFVSCPDGVLRPFGVLADAVRAQHLRQPPHLPPAAPSDLHLKMATTGDLENDGDIDIWVESDGGSNMNSHFVVNNGDGSFTIDIRNRATDPVHHNSPPTWWRYHEALFMDIDHDGDSDLVLGQLRDPSRLDQFSIVLINDGRGYFPTRTELPHPTFNDGVTRVFGIARFDINRDGADDLFMLHVRNGPRRRLDGALHPGAAQHGRRQLRGRDVDPDAGRPARHGDRRRHQPRWAGDARRRPRRLPGPGGDGAAGRDPVGVAAGLPQQRQRAVLATAARILRLGR